VQLISFLQPPFSDRGKLRDKTERFANREIIED